jgi:hypothetical protein
LCCNCLSPEWRECVNGCVITDGESSESSYEVIFLHSCSLGPVCFTSNPCGLGVEGDY